ncbi:MAG: hypothetical protein LGR52_04825 [Candidatus Thiosymbion ectosymbiont of Robbea hypermnestra]|nr:hypothetical protein [Candidatus Thiosymbion ectosymbiont of Robbea hypermnestra]
MPSPATSPDAGPDGYLPDAIRLPEATLNRLFAALLATLGGGFLGGNLLFADPLVLARSGPMALACLAVLTIFYTLTRSLGSPAWGLALTYLLLWVTTVAYQPWLIALVYALAAFGLLYTLRFLRLSTRQWGTVLLMGAIGAATAFTATQTQIQFDMLPRIHAGEISQDFLYNAAIAAMVKHYGVVSTGLHGLVETPYHAFSHTLMAGLSRLSGHGVLAVYGVARPLLFIPLLIFSLVACAALLDRAGRSTSIPIAWSVACVLLVATPLLLEPWMFPAIYLISESYMIALGLFLLGFPLLFKTRLSVSDLLLMLLLAVLLAETKVSVGLLFAGLWLVRLLFMPGKRPALEPIAALAALVATALLTLHPMIALGSEGGGLSLSPFNIIRVYSFGGHWISQVIDALRAGTPLPWGAVALALLALLGFFLFHFLFSWLVIGWAIRHQGIPALWRNPTALYSLATVLSGTLVISLFYLPGYTSCFFSDIAFLVALPTVVTLITRRIGRRRITGTAALALGISILVASNLQSYHRASASLSRRTPHQQHPFIESLLRVRDRSPTNITLKPAPSVLKENPFVRCSARPFVFPAISERPWTGVIPSYDDCRYLRYYGYAQYGISASHPLVTLEAPLLPDMTIHHWSPRRFRSCSGR